MATPQKHVNVLQHLAGLLQGPARGRREAGASAASSRITRGALVPLVVPITLVNHYVTRFDLAYIRDQVYLRPHPKELMLRNHV